MNCKDCLPLIPSYVDEELSEAQAAPLRQHLMDCRICRKALLGEKAFKRWFDFDLASDVAVPDGFAERVARRAFAGDGGSALAFESSAAGFDEDDSSQPILQFVLRATAIAAGLLLVVSVLTFSTRLPDGSNVHGTTTILEKDQILKELELLADPASSVGLPQAEPGKSGLKDMSTETKPEVRTESSSTDAVESGGQ